MGNTSQCNTNNYNSSLITLYEKLQTTLSNPSSPIEKSLISEYTNIQKRIYSKQFHSKSITKYEKCTISSKVKNLSNYLSLKKQKMLLHTWLSILTSNINTSSSFINQVQSNILSYKQSNYNKFIKLLANGTPNSIRHLIWLSFTESNSLSLPVLHIPHSIHSHIEDQINKDLYRTYFHNETYTDEQLSQLHSLLTLYAYHNKQIGYCQGMNFIAKFILINTNYHIEDSFHIMTFVFNNINGYFIDNFPLLKTHLHLFDYFFKQILPKLYEHFIQLELPNEIWIGKWIQTLFTMNVPYEITCRIWDSLFAYGFEFVIPFCISLLKQMENDLLKLNDSYDVIEFFKESLFPKDTIDIYRNQEKSIISVDKVIKEGNRMYKEIKEEFMKRKKEFEKEENERNMSMIETEVSLMKKEECDLSLNESDICEEYLDSDIMNMRNMEMWIMEVKRNSMGDYMKRDSYIEDKEE